ncbi:MAG: hypothetical protein OXE99_02945 [Cellvibrionales bacterium]|nr:hypothetical protein [Cellvibrionales bacterium]
MNVRSTKSFVLFGLFCMTMVGSWQSAALPVFLVNKPKGPNTENYLVFRTQLDEQLENAKGLNDISDVINRMEAGDLDASLNKDILFQQLKENVVGWLAEGVGVTN